MIREHVKFTLCILLAIAGVSPVTFPLYGQQIGNDISAPVAGLPQLADTLSPDVATDTASLPVVVDSAPTIPAPGIPVADSDSAKNADRPRIPVKDYLYAEEPRYTLTGKTPYLKTHVEALPTILTATAVAGAITGIHVYQQDAWWKDRRTGFHMVTDWGYAAQADKFGHFFAGYFTSYIGYESLVASGFTSKTAGWLGPLLALGFQSYVEVEDGFSPFGFDPTDEAANVIGPLFFSAQNFVPLLQNFKFKWSYFPSDRLQSGEFDGHNTIVIDNYNGQTAWFSIKLGNLLPKSIGWPKWLRLAVGYGAYNVDQWYRGENGEPILLPAGRRFYISFDYDLVDLLPDLGSFGNWLVQTADFLHFPAPALELGPDLKPKLFLAYPIEF